MTTVMARPVPPASPRKGQIESFAEGIVNKLGIPPNLHGYDYLMQAVALCIRAPGVHRCLTKELYPLLAQHFKTSAHCVERSIRHAIAQAWDDGTSVYWREVFADFHSYDPAVKPTAGKLIAMAAMLYCMEE